MQNIIWEKLPALPSIFNMGGSPPPPPRRYPDGGGPGKLLLQNRQAGVPREGFMNEISVSLNVTYIIMK